jgi:transmembrane sensor
MRFGFAAAALAAVCCLTVVLAPSLLLRVRADHVTATAELRRLTLQDGTVVHLAPQSAVDAHYTAERRAVTLLAGEAFFEVVPDAQRPFVVEAQGLEARALGTAFDVRLAPRSLSVEVESGAVAVRHAGSEARLGPGDRLTIDRDNGAAQRDRPGADDIAGWRDGRLFVEDATVEQVVEALRRYQPGWIVIADERLAAHRVTGLYDLREPSRALRALVQPAGGRVREVTPLLRILSAP